jgi:hypothetical protein
MARADKILKAMAVNPRDWRIEDLETVARAFGCNVRKSGGSHVYFMHPQVSTALSVPARRPIKPVYVKAFVELIRGVQTR